MIRFLLCASFVLFLSTLSSVYAEQVVVNEYGCVVADLAPVHSQYLDSTKEIVQLFRSTSRALVRAASSAEQKTRLRKYRQRVLKQFSLSSDASSYLFDGLAKEDLQSCQDLQACSLEDQSQIVTAIVSEKTLERGMFRKLFKRLERLGVRVGQYKKAYRELRRQSLDTLQLLPATATYCT